MGMSRLDWEKAHERDRAREAAQAREGKRPSTDRRAALRQKALADFVEQHGLTCFKCGAAKAEWAKTGISKQGPWAICVPCASAPR
jgi:hypothetical protein